MPDDPAAGWSLLSKTRRCSASKAAAPMPTASTTKAKAIPLKLMHVKNSSVIWQINLLIAARFQTPPSEPECEERSDGRNGPEGEHQGC
jgi:hypothetical protein